MALIELSGISKRFKHLILFEDLTAEFAEGAIHGIVGPNGSGKSVLFKIICGFVRPDAGSVAIDPRYKNPHDNFPKEFGILIDRPGYLAHASGVENLVSLAKIRGAVGVPEIEECMRELGLDPRSRLAVAKYSLGMKQKLSIAQAVMEKQRVLLLDEPFNALDESSRSVVHDMLKRFRRGGGTVLFTSHHKSDIVDLCDVVFALDEGKLKPQ